MAEAFDPSPRASKRRRTTTVDEEDKSVPASSEATTPTTSTRLGRSGTTRTNSRGRGRTNGQSDDPSTEEGHPNHDESNANDDDHDMAPPRSSGRERKKPRRFSASPEPTKPKVKPTSAKQVEQVESIQPAKKQKPATPKGILTPSRKERTGNRKTVAFGSSEKAIEAQLGFKDIDSSTKQKNTTTETANTEAKATPSKKSRKLSQKPTAEVTTDEVDPSHTSHPQQTEEEEVDLDQLLEAQQWTATEASTPVPAAAVAPLSLDDEPAMLGIKFEVLSRLHGSSTSSQRMIPSHLENQYRSIHNVLTATITAGESNSLLVLGSRGSGKTHILKIALDDLKSKYASDFHTVRLNGFFQTDDKLALREIWRQLGREMNIDEEESEGAGSYADTMASLLSLLSRPDELINPGADGGYTTGITSTGTISKSIVFMLDEFDLFTTHPRQTLLYNLFDIAQSRKAPIAVIGCSTRMDVVECLEKRVKSRFSHRWVHLPSAKSVDGLQAVLETALIVDEEIDSNGKRSTKKEIEARKRWNSFIKTVYLPSTPVQDSIRRVFYTTKSIPDLFAALYLSIATLRVSVSGESSTFVLDKALVPLPPQLISILSSLPTLQLSLLVAAARLDAIHNLGAFNFNLVYDHYTELIARSKLQQTASGAVAVGAGLRQWTHDMAREAWEDLGEWSLIVPVSGNSGPLGRDTSASHSGGGGGEGANVRMWRVDVTLDDLVWALKHKSEAGGTAAGAVDVLIRWCKEI